MSKSNYNYRVRVNCEYTIDVEAENPEQAQEIAEAFDLCEWDTASWSETEVIPLNKVGVEVDE
jgi:hypothetical protein